MHYVETHGFEILIAYFAFASIVSSMPPLPSGSSYWANWAYGLLHAFASDWKHMMEMAKAIPAEPNSTTVKTEVKQTTIENVTTPAPPKE